jgi:hypothetical protein
MATFTINIPQMLAYIPYMDPMGIGFHIIGIYWWEDAGDAKLGLQTSNEKMNKDDP